MVDVVNVVVVDVVVVVVAWAGVGWFCLFGELCVLPCIPNMASLDLLWRVIGGQKAFVLVGWICNGGPHQLALLERSRALFQASHADSSNITVQFSDHAL